MYAMSWEVNNKDYKYESIQYGYEIEYYDDEELDVVEIPLEEMLELEDEELELEELAEAI